MCIKLCVRARRVYARMPFRGGHSACRIVVNSDRDVSRDLLLCLLDNQYGNEARSRACIPISESVTGERGFPAAETILPSRAACLRVFTSSSPFSSFPSMCASRITSGMSVREGHCTALRGPTHRNDYGSLGSSCLARKAERIHAVSVHVTHRKIRQIKKNPE